MRQISIACLLLTALHLAAENSSAQSVYNGRAGEITVHVPRLEAESTVDGVLDEPVWTEAARLTDFSQFQPVDGRPAVEPTEVLVWYAPDAIHFGIRATEVHGDVVRATRANRDNIASEDKIQILLDTYDDNQIAFLFGVNPFGVQEDGTRSDQFGGGAGGRSATGGGSARINPLDGNVDLNPDFHFDSAGRVTSDGYVVEVRIPFKSLRYQDADVQNWGIHILRRVQHSGFQDTWAPAVRANASFLGQSGSLTGLRDLERGLVLDVTPTATGRLDGAPADDGSWEYADDVQIGGDIRWGIRQNLTLNGTVNPDFSQVEADVGQVVLNERFALFFPEKRPFFLEGLELFDSPNQLIYTRRIVSPEAGVKLAGKVDKLNVATILAVDDQDLSVDGETLPLFGVARLRRDLPGNGTLGGVLTTREEGSDYSRLVGLDSRLYHSQKYFVELQAVQSWTRTGAETPEGVESDPVDLSGPLFGAAWDRTGRTWGFNQSIYAVSPEFRAAAGFVNRVNVFRLQSFNRLTAYGREGAFIETIGAFGGGWRIWAYDDLGAGPIEGNEFLFPSATLRGGWNLSANVGRNFFEYDPANYAGLEVEDGSGGLESFDVPEREDDQFYGSFTVTTPTYRMFTATASVSRSRTPIFAEAAPGLSSRYDAAIDLRPTPSIRATLQATHLTLERRRDGSQFSKELIPRLKVEYQLTPAIFFRVITQYTARERSALRDRDGRLIYVGGDPSEASESDRMRMDWLFSYRPSPGTLVYFGYGSTLDDVGQQRFRSFERQFDGFFAKLSYLIRV
ncbi:MAG: carbohydrate binding family 9 domain-containing protein [Rhodothermales bacterium]|nr:carbohydrate binding family 9 domain-containing protein [Rhodothermales bacterium]